VVRFRKTVIAAVALSALALTPTAAYAHDHHGVSGGSGGGMSWAHSRGDLTAYTDNIFAGAEASAVMIGINDRSFFRLRVSGIDKSASREEPYGVHLHAGKCIPTNDPDIPNPGAPGYGAGIHYNVAWHPLDTTIPLEKVNNKNEIWLDLKVDSEGNASRSATVEFIPEEGPRSIVLHALETNSDTGIAGARLACLPFNINVYGD
jgi:Cu/Zn superoxide dismutase